MAALTHTDPALIGAFAIFSAESRKFLACAERQLSAGDPAFAELYNGFHKIKGGAGFFGLEQMRTSAAEAEAAALRKSVAEIDSLSAVVQQLRALLDSACSEGGDTNG